jgi:hypothetical protein
MNIATVNRTTHKELLDVLADFERESGLFGVDYEIRERSDGELLIIKLSQPNERLYRILERVVSGYTSTSLFPPRATLERTAKPNILKSAESRLLLRVLSESLTINRHSFEEGFFDRYIKSVFGAEEQIVSANNHIVFGRRGSGKSSLLLYAMHRLAEVDAAYAWVDMQVYSHRADLGVVADLIGEIIDQVNSAASSIAKPEIEMRVTNLKRRGPDLTPGEIQALLPDLKRYFAPIVKERGKITIFLDDFHVLNHDLQPRALGLLYAFARGNRIFFKISAIETLTKNWDPSTRAGLEIPHDAQVIRLDYNLTAPEKASQHIKSILDRHAVFSGLPSISILANKKATLDRLVWVAAGVPRDALSIFGQAMTKAAIEDRTNVSATNINAAASEMADVKLRDLELDASGSFAHPIQLLEQIKTFCLAQQKKNAFLVERKNDEPLFESILQLIDLRLLHVISEGITVREAGQKYMALILDYSFYVGLRAAKSIDLFNTESARPRYDELRTLPIFTGASASKRA